MAHPAIVSRDSRLGGPKFQFMSCSGAISTDIIKNQIPGLEGGQDAILLSVGESLRKYNVRNGRHHVPVSRGFEQIC